MAHAARKQSGHPAGDPQRSVHRAELGLCQLPVQTPGATVRKSEARRALALSASHGGVDGAGTSRRTQDGGLLSLGRLPLKSLSPTPPGAGGGPGPGPAAREARNHAPVDTGPGSQPDLGGQGGPRPVRPTPRLPARATHLVSQPRAGGAAAEPEAEAQAERGAQQHGGRQQRGRGQQRVPAQQQARVAPAGRPAAGHRGRSGRGPAASRRRLRRPRQAGDAGLGAPTRPGRGAHRGLGGLRSLPTAASLQAPALRGPEGGAWIVRPKLGATAALSCPCTEHAPRAARVSGRWAFRGVRFTLAAGKGRPGRTGECAPLTFTPDGLSHRPQPPSEMPSEMRTINHPRFPSGEEARGPS